MVVGVDEAEDEDEGGGEGAVFGSEPDGPVVVVDHQAIVVWWSGWSDRGCEVSALAVSSYLASQATAAAAEKERAWVACVRMVGRLSAGSGVLKRMSVWLYSASSGDTNPVVYAQCLFPRFYWTFAELSELTHTPKKFGTGTRQGRNGQGYRQGCTAVRTSAFKTAGAEAGRSLLDRTLFACPTGSRALDPWR